MANDSYTQQALASDPRFRQRVKAAGAKVSQQVLDEDSGIANHAERATYARQVIANIDGWAVQIAPWLVMRTSVFAFATSYDFAAAAVVSACGDADIEAQLVTDWNDLAGV